MDREYARKIELSKRPPTVEELLFRLNDEIRVLNGLGQFDSRFKEMLKDQKLKLSLAQQLNSLTPEQKIVFYGLDQDYQLYEVLAPELKPVRKPVVTSIGMGKVRMCKKCGLKRM